MAARDNVKKGLQLILVDFLGLVVGILNGFFLPGVFNIEGYALFRTFTLYATFATVFSLGISDGLYLLYGGKAESSTDRGETKAYYYFLIQLQTIIFLLLFLLAFYVFKDNAFLYFSLFIVPLQLIHFFRMYYRALGEFDRYSRFQGILVFLELINTLLVAFYAKSGQPDLFIIIKIINHLIVAALLTAWFMLKNKDVKAVKPDRQQLLKLMKPGCIVLVADMVVALLSSIDRFVVKVHFEAEAFAYYSFAVSILTLFLTFITSITSVFYSYISRKAEDTSYMVRLKTYILLISSSFLLAYYPLRMIIQTFLEKYSKALDFLWILMLTLPLIGMVNIVFINMYKATGRLKTYLMKLLVIVFVTAVGNIVAVQIFGTLTSIAVVTLISYAFWYALASRDFIGLKLSIREALYLFTMYAGFIITEAFRFNIIAGFLIYLVIWIVAVMTFYKNELVDMVQIIRSSYKIMD